MMTEQLKNPILIGIIMSLITYLYLRWESNQKHKDNPEATKKSVNMMIPVAVGALSWFIFSTYLNQQGIVSVVPMDQPAITNEQAVSATGGPLEQIAGKNNTVAYTKAPVRRDIKLPASDVFIDLADF